MNTDELIRKAHELKSKGLSTYEIADELKVQPDTVVWLLLRAKERRKKPAPFDVFIDWSPIGSHTKRLSSIAMALADLALESIRKGDFADPEIIVAIEGAGMALGISVAHELGRPFAAVKPHRLAERTIPGLVNPSFSSVENRRVLLVDSVLRAGETHKAAIDTLKDSKAKTIGIVVLANKSGRNRIDGIPLKALIELLPVSGP